MKMREIPNSVRETIIHHGIFSKSFQIETYTMKLLGEKVARDIQDTLLEEL